MHIIATRTFIIDSPEGVTTRQEFIDSFWSTHSLDAQRDIMNDLEVTSDEYQTLPLERQFQLILDYICFSLSGGDLTGWGTELPEHAVIAELVRDR